MARRDDRSPPPDPAPRGELPAGSYRFMHTFRPRALGETLLEQKVIDESQLETALIFQKARPGTKLGTVLRDLGYLSSRDFIEALSSRLPVVKPFGGS